MTTAAGTTSDPDRDEASRCLLIAAVGARAAFLGLMAMSAGHATMMGGVAAIVGVGVVCLALRRLVRDHLLVRRL